MTFAQDEPAVRLAYDEVADTYADHFRSTEPELHVELAMIAHFASLLPRGALLDAGCGAGRMMPVLAAHGCRVEEVDLSPAMVRRSRRDHSAYPSQVASLGDLPFPDDSFDGVFSWYSTIHTTEGDLPRILNEVRRVLQPGGLFLVAFQSGQGVRDVSENYRRRGPRSSCTVTTGRRMGSRPLWRGRAWLRSPGSNAPPPPMSSTPRR
ncbi:MAG: class I SAM-dependent methyltransferase [Mycobacteriaceae bacterium]